MAEEREKKAVNYLSFSGRGDEDINNFITKLEKAFAVNRVINSKKHLVVISCLKEIAANFYDGLVRITNWNMVKQAINTQLRPALITRFRSEAQTIYYYN